MSTVSLLLLECIVCTFLGGGVLSDHFFTMLYTFCFPPAMNDWIKAEAAGVKQSEICLVSFADLNVPLANSKERMGEIMQAIAAMNDISPARHIGLIECADTPKKSSKRGMADEEKELQETLWSLKQQCDTRWILPFDVPEAAQAHSSRRQMKTN